MTHQEKTEEEQEFTLSRQLEEYLSGCGPRRLLRPLCYDFPRPRRSRRLAQPLAIPSAIAPPNEQHRPSSPEPPHEHEDTFELNARSAELLADQVHRLQQCTALMEQRIQKAGNEVYDRLRAASILILALLVVVLGSMWLHYL